MIEEYIKLLGTGFSASGLLLAGIWWLNKDRASAVHLLEAERMKRIESLEQQSDQCAKDRLFLHSQIQALQAEVRDLMRGIMVASKHGCGVDCLKVNKEQHKHE